MNPLPAEPLDPRHLEAALSGPLSQWTLDPSGQLCRDLRFPDFDSLSRWIRQLLDLAAEEDHHPQVEFGYRTARVLLFTHDCHALSLRDLRLAERLEACL